MSFPSSPTNGQVYNDWTFNSTVGTWMKDSTPHGTIRAHAGSTVPSGYLLCDGTSYTTTTYPTLFTAIAYAWGGSGTTFNVPDMRETIPVGVGTRGSGVTTHDIYTLAQFKDDQVQGLTHNHTPLYYNQTWHSVDGGNVAVCTSSLTGYNSVGIPGGTTAGATWDNASGVPRFGTVTHAKQVGVTYIIKI
jgi:microcystin-dependent protein